MKDPIDAFAWLLKQFRSYAHGELTWLEVREVLREAEALRQEYAASTESDISFNGSDHYLFR